jgi:hypothetical protein
MEYRKPIATALAILVGATGIAACGDDNGGGGTTAAGPTSTLPQGSEPVDLNPADFTTKIDNPYWPMKVGSKWVYRETDAEGARMRVEVTVTDQTKKIANDVEARVVRDIVTDEENGEKVEDTFDWYAQDKDGNIWYMGEDTKEFENGKVKTTAGSWEAGVDGAQAGVVVPANPEPGLAYRQEYYKGEAEDNGKVLALDGTADVPFGMFENCLKTEDTTPLEPDLVENKLYAKGVGPVEATTIAGGSDHEVLLTYTKGK